MECSGHAGNGKACPDKECGEDPGETYAPDDVGGTGCSGDKTETRGADEGAEDDGQDGCDGQGDDERYGSGQSG